MCRPSLWLLLSDHVNLLLQSAKSDPIAIRWWIAVDSSEINYTDAQIAYLHISGSPHEFRLCASFTQTSVLLLSSTSGLQKSAADVLIKGVRNRTLLAGCRHETGWLAVDATPSRHRRRQRAREWERYAGRHRGVCSSRCRCFCGCRCHRRCPKPD